MKVVFVHGALVFDGAWWWHRTVGPLAALGLDTRAVELPSCVAPPVPPAGVLGDMRADADAVRVALEEEDDPVVLVGHSYGGMVITDAAAGFCEEGGPRDRGADRPPSDALQTRSPGAGDLRGRRYGWLMPVRGFGLRRGSGFGSGGPA